MEQGKYELYCILAVLPFMVAESQVSIFLGGHYKDTGRKPSPKWVVYILYILGYRIETTGSLFRMYRYM
jgi:hypothetical protein